MRVVMVAVVAPCRHQFSGMTQVVEEVLVQDFVKHSTVNAFSEAVLHWLAGGDVTPLDLPVLLPLQDHIAGQLWPVARREEGPLRSYGHARNPQIAQRVTITGSQVSTVVLHNLTAEETGYDR